MARAVLGFIVMTGMIIGVSSYGHAEAKVGESAPIFTLKDSEGREFSLESYRGRFVVLEWVNFDCPFVGKHYGSGNMQALQSAYIEKNVAWLSICSSAPGRQGYFEKDELAERMEKEKAVPTAYLLDAEGAVGRMYGARTTPHMFIINPEGTLIYAGGIDDKPSTDKDDISDASNYVKLVLEAALEGKAIPVTSSKPYGCSVKYQR